LAKIVFIGIIGCMIEAVIFDMDGLMVDTESIYTEAMREMAKRRGKDFTLDVKQWLIGRIGIDSMEIFKERLGLLDAPKDLLMERERLLKEILPRFQLHPMPGLTKLLSLLKRMKKKRAVASSSKRSWVDTVLLHLGLKEEFEIVVSGDDVKRGKPSPEIYLLVAKRLSVSPKKCLVLEDTPVGVMAAKSAGMRCIACPNRYTLGLNFSQADVVVRGLDEISEEMIENWG
jgi:HAD superfamily hydrolase (TIGR01509 family)